MFFSNWNCFSSSCRSCSDRSRRCCSCRSWSLSCWIMLRSDGTSSWEEVSAMEVAERRCGMGVVRADSHNSSEPESQSRLPDIADESSLAGQALQKERMDCKKRNHEKLKIIKISCLFKMWARGPLKATFTYLTVLTRFGW